jgi:hypothetical protein
MVLKGFIKHTGLPTSINPECESDRLSLKKHDTH